MLLIPFRFVLAGTAGISCAGMQSEMVLPPIPPQVKFRPISGCFGRSGQFRPILGGMEISAGIGFAFKKKNSILQLRCFTSQIRCSQIHLHM